MRKILIAMIRIQRITNFYVVNIAIVVITMLGGCMERTMTREIHYIPRGFIGQVSINFNSKNGLRREYLNGARIYRIPLNGILNTRFGINTGWTSGNSTYKFIYYNPSSDEQQVLSRIDGLSENERNKLDSNDIVIKQLVYLSHYDMNGNDIKSLMYFVDTLKSKKYYRNY